MRNAFKELAKDFKNATGLASSNIEERALSHIGYWVDEYDNQLKE